MDRFENWSASRAAAAWSRGFAFALLPLALACERAPEGAAEPEVHRGGTLVVAAPADLSQPNPFVAADEWTQEVNRELLYVPLLRLTPELEYAPGLAETWQADDSTATFTLRRDVRWSDGTPTSAHDVVFTIERLMDPATTSPNASYFSRWSSVEAPDSYTVRVRYEPHAEPLAGLPFMPIMPRHALDSIPAERMAQAAFNQRPVGNGPFRLVLAQRNDRWVFERNPDFPESLGGPPNVDRLVWRVVTENTSQAVEVQTGQAHLALAPSAQDVPRLDARPDLRAIVKPSRKYAMIIWNGRRAPLDQPQVRRALMMAIDREEILQALRDGHGELAAGPIAPHHWAYDDDVRPLPFDSAGARRLLAEAGVADRNGDGRLETPGGQPFRIELKVAAASAFQRDMAEMIRSDLAALGIDASVRPLEFNTLVGDLMSADRNFDAALMGWSSDFKVNVRESFHSSALDGPFQSAQYTNPEVDRLIEQGETLVDRDEARPVHRRLQEIMRDEQPWGFLYYFPDLYVAREELKGVDMDIRGTFATAPDWWLDPEAAAPADSAAPVAPADSAAVAAGGE